LMATRHSSARASGSCSAWLGMARPMFALVWAVGAVRPSVAGEWACVGTHQEVPRRLGHRQYP
jgi:hypothetical protein